MELSLNQRLAADYEERLNSLLSDGYCKRFDHPKRPFLWFPS